MAGRESWASLRFALYNALYSMVVPVSAILVLSPADYGFFSLMYLVLAWGTSLTYSLIAEPWARSGNHRLPWPAFSTAMLSLSGAMVLLCFAVGLIMGRPSDSAVIAVGIGLTLYRTGARYYSAYVGSRIRVGRPDLIGAVTFVAAFISLGNVLGPIESLGCGWVVAGVVSCWLSEMPRIDRTMGPARWVKTHWGIARPLFVDSTLLDFGSVGVPLVLAPFMGAADFGTYRSVTSAALPVRLVLNPIRPYLAMRNLQRLVCGGTAVGVCAVAGILGGSGLLSLVWVKSKPWFEGTVVDALAEYSLAAGLFIFSNFIGMFYYLVARAHLDGRSILAYRSIQFGAAIVVPIGSFWLFGISGAVWGLVVNGALVGLLAFYLVRRAAARVLDATGAIADEGHGGV